MRIEPAALPRRAARLGGQRRGQPARARSRRGRRAVDPAAARVLAGRRVLRARPAPASRRASRTTPSRGSVRRTACSPTTGPTSARRGSSSTRSCRDRASSTTATGSATSARSARRTTTRRSTCSSPGPLRPGLQPDSALDRLAIRLNLAPVAAGHALFGMPMARVTMAGQRLGIFARLARGPATAHAAGRRSSALIPTARCCCSDSLAALEHVDKQRGPVLPLEERAQVARSRLGRLRRDVHRALLRLLELVGPAGGHRAHRRGHRDPRLPARRSPLGDVHPRPVRAGAHQLPGGREGAAAARPADVPARRRRRPRLVLGRAVPPPSNPARDGASTCRAAPRSDGASSPSRA